MRARDSVFSLRSAQIVAILIISTILPPIAAQEEETVLVRRLVPANFHDPALDLDRFDAVLNNSLPRIVQVEPGDTLSGILSREFRLSSTWTPAAFDTALSNVKARNAIENDVDLQAGTELQLPDLPQTSQTPKKPSSQWSAAKISSGMKWNALKGALLGSPVLSPASSAVGTSELQVREVSLKKLKSLFLSKGRHIDEAETTFGEYEVLQEQVALLLEAEAAVPAVDGLDKPTQDHLRRFLQRSAATRPILVILDDGWPAQEDFASAMRFTIAASKEIREKFSLQASRDDLSTDIKTLMLEGRNGTTFCNERCEYPALLTHSSMIRKSLDEFTVADANQRVEVIYLPLNMAQTFARQILGEMIRVSLLADGVTNRLVVKGNGYQYPVGITPGTPDYALAEAQVKKMLSSNILNRPQMVYQGSELTLTTDKSILDGIANFLWLYSIASQRPYFLSMSWTAPSLTYAPVFRPEGYGLLLAAAGNNPAINVHAKSVQFAARSSDPGDVVAVENPTSGCGTSSTALGYNIPVLSLSFPGRVSPTICGTSFSTPRVAWLLAAKEAIKGVPIVPGVNGWTELWRARQRTELLPLSRPMTLVPPSYADRIWTLLAESPTP